MAENTAPPATKRCTRCKRSRSLQQFGVDRKRKDGLNLWCKACKAKARRREYLRVKLESSCGVQLRLDLDIKVCARCKTLKVLNDFGRDKHRKDGHAPYCLACSRILMSETWLRNRQAWTARNLKWRRENRRAALDIAQRRLARQKSAATVPFTKDQLLAKWDYWGRRCWICGEEATSTDHVKPLSKGGAHMLCNLRPICRPCNSTKSGRWPFDLHWIRSRRNA